MVGIRLGLFIIHIQIIIDMSVKYLKPTRLEQLLSNITVFCC